MSTDEAADGDESGEAWKKGGAKDDARPDAEKEPHERDGRYIRGFSIKLGQLLIAGRRSEYEIGQFIHEARLGKYWERWPSAEGKCPTPPRGGIPEMWCDKVLGFKKRKAEYLLNNYLRLAEIKPPEDVLARALRLGWTKLAVVLRVAQSVDSLIKWLDRIETHGLTEAEVDAEVRQAIASAGADGDESDDGDEKPDTEAPARRPKESIVFDNPDDLRIWTKVRGIIKDRFEVGGKGAALGLICTAYLSCLPRNDEGGVEAELDHLAMHISRTYGKRVVLLDADSTSAANEERIRRARAQPLPPPAAQTPAPSGGSGTRSAALDV